MQQSRFVILSLPRSGAPQLAELLERHPRLACPREVFWGRPQVGQTPPAARLAAALATAEAAGRKAGFIHHYNGHPEAEVELLLDRSIRKVLLVRSNLLASYAALQRVESRHQPAAFAAETFQAHCWSVSSAYGRYLTTLLATGQPFRVVTYWDVMFRRLTPLLRFLEVDPYALRPADDGPVIVEPVDIAGLFCNPQAVRDCLLHFGRGDWLFDRPGDAGGLQSLADAGYP